jgi:hypothetical protein
MAEYRAWCTALVVALSLALLLAHVMWVITPGRVSAAITPKMLREISNSLRVKPFFLLGVRREA